MATSSTFSVSLLSVIKDLGLQPIWSPEFDHEWHMENDPEWIDPEDWENFVADDGTLYSILYSFQDTGDQETVVLEEYHPEDDVDENGNIIYY